MRIGRSLVYSSTSSADNPATRPAAHWDATFDELLSTGQSRQWTLHIGESFTDVPRDHPFYAFVENIFHNGITGGCTAGNYCPSDPVTRQQIAVFLLLSEHKAGYVPPPCTIPHSSGPTRLRAARQRAAQRWVRSIAARV